MDAGYGPCGRSSDEHKRLKAAKAQDNTVEERTNEETEYFKQYCNMSGMCVLTMKASERKGCTKEERDEQGKREKETAEERGENQTSEKRTT